MFKKNKKPRQSKLTSSYSCAQCNKIWYFAADDLAFQIKIHDMYYHPQEQPIPPTYTAWNCLECGLRIDISKPPEHSGLVALHKQYHKRENKMENKNTHISFDCVDNRPSTPKVTFYNTGRGGGNTAHALKKALTAPINTRSLLVTRYAGTAYLHPIIKELKCQLHPYDPLISTPSGAEILIKRAIDRGQTYDLIVIDQFNDFPIDEQKTLKERALQYATTEVLLTGPAEDWFTCDLPAPKPFSYERFKDYRAGYTSFPIMVILFDPETHEHVQITRSTISYQDCHNPEYNYEVFASDPATSRDIQNFTKDNFEALWHYAHFLKEKQ